MKIQKFGLPTCKPCKDVEEYFNSKNIDYENIDLSLDENLDLGVKYGIRRVPVTILLNDKDVPLKKVLGFNTQELDELLNDFTNGNI